MSVDEPQIEPRLAARRRAVRAVFDAYNHARAPFYLYAELSGRLTKGSVQTAQTPEEADTWAQETARSPGEVYVAVFVAEGPNWPGPAYDVYHPALQEHLAVAGGDGIAVAGNGRGQYGTRLLGGGSLFSRAPWGGAPDPTSTSWLYRGPRAFHGHEAPTFGRHGAWPPQRERGTYGRGALQVGSPREAVGRLFHTVEDRADAVKQLDHEWDALYRVLAVQAGELTLDPKAPSGTHLTTQAEYDALNPAPKMVAWWKGPARTQLNQWLVFRRDQLGLDKTVAPDYQAWTERFTTDWSVYEEWRNKLDLFREEAKQAGFRIDLPETRPLPSTVWTDVKHGAEKVVEKVADKVGDVWTLAKYGLWGALGIGAVVALSSVAQNLRSGRDPAENYLEVIRRRRGGSRALAASPSIIELPSSAVRELPDGSS